MNSARICWTRSTVSRPLCEWCCRVSGLYTRHVLWHIPRSLPRRPAFSLLAPPILRAVGIDPARARAQQRIATVSGYVVAPVVIIPRLQCLGQHCHQCQALAHALPFGSLINSVLGGPQHARQKTCTCYEQNQNRVAIFCSWNSTGIPTRQPAI